MWAPVGRGGFVPWDDLLTLYMDIKLRFAWAAWTAAILISRGVVN